MICKALGLILALIGPLAVWLLFAHFLRDFPTHDMGQFAAYVLALTAGTLGAWLFLREFENWSDHIRILIGFAYVLLLILIMPLMGFIASCSIGNCL